MSPAERRRPLRPLAAVALVLALAACAALDDTAKPIELAAPKPGEADSAVALAAAQAALAAERHDEAEASFKIVLAHQADHGAARLGLAEVALGRGRATEAADRFAALTQVAELRPRALQGQGLALVMARQDKAALAALQQAVSEQPTLWRAWNGLGLVHADAREWVKAEQAYGKALAVNPHSALIENNLGFALMLQRKYPAASEHFAKALALDPGFTLARENQRLALAWQGRYVEAIAGAGDKELPAVLNDVGYIAMLRGDTASAESYFVRAMEASPSYNALAARNLARLRNTGSKSERPLLVTPQ
jgi:Flp pilus assembly protein TadD